MVDNKKTFLTVHLSQRGPESIEEINRGNHSKKTATAV